MIYIEHHKNIDTDGGAGNGISGRKFLRRADDGRKESAVLELLIVKRKQSVARVWIALYTLILAALLAVTGQMPQLVEAFVNRVAVDNQVQLKRPTERGEIE